MEGPCAGRSAAIQEVERAIAALSSSRAPVLLVGERGTGKRYFARMLHEASGAAEFVVLSTEAGPIDAEALRGAAESARGGTLVIAGIERLNREAQEALVALASGGEARIVATSEAPCDAEDGPGSALFASSTVKLPSLHERAEDIPLLAQRFFELHASRACRADLRGVSPEAMALLEEHTFETNVRGLEQAIERAVQAAEGPYVTAADLPEEVDRPRQSNLPLLLGSLPAQGLDLRAAMEELETHMILQALERTGWNKNRASRLLGLNRTTLVEMIKRKRLAPPRAQSRSTPFHRDAARRDEMAAE